MKRHVIVVGGGASGLAAAIAASREGSRVTVLEHNDRVGKKILVTGNGKCNMTNRNMGSEHFRSENPGFVEQILWKYPTETILRFFEELGIYPTERNGYVYPASGQAASVLDVLRMELAYRGVEVETGVHAECVKRRGEVLTVEAVCRGEDACGVEKRWTYQAHRVILACGSLAGNHTGNDGSGYRMAEQMGHRIVTPLPALVQLRSAGTFLKQWAGVRTEAAVRLWSDGTCMAADRGEVQLTDYGISGIPVFQVSRFAAAALNEGKTVLARLDFFPEMTRKELYRCMEQRFENCPYKSLDDMTVGLLNKKLASVLVREAGLDGRSSWGHLSKAQKYHLCEMMDDFPLPIHGTNAFAQAQVCMGGVDTREINPKTMESKKMQGVYFAGELMDADGICGGYNLHFAWATGLAAGKHAGGDETV